MHWASENDKNFIAELVSGKQNKRLIWEGQLPNGKKKQYWENKDIDWELHLTGQLKQGGNLCFEIDGKKYAKELSTSIFNSTGAGRGRPIFPNKWDTNDALIGLREKYYERFKKLSPLARRIATTEFLNIISEKKDGQKNIRLDAIPPIIDSIEKETLLDLAIMKAYGKSYDKRLDDANEIRDELKCL